MTNRAVPHATVKSRPLFAPLALLAAAAMMLLGFSGSASAAKPIGKGGSVQACYKFKGKKKGSLRVVPTGKSCKRGERKLAWSIAGAPGQAGATGAQGASGGTGQSQNGADGGTGANGASGASGANGASGTTAALESKIAGLNLKIDGLEGTLDGLSNGELTGVVDTLDGLTNTELTGVVDTLGGVTNGELTGALATVDGITNGELTGALATVEGITNGELTGALGKLDGVSGAQLDDLLAGLPVLDDVCAQVHDVTGQTTKLGTALGGFSLNNVLTALGGAIAPPKVTPLPEFNC